MSRSRNHAHAHWSRRRWYEKRMLEQRADDRAREPDHYAAHEAEAPVDTRRDLSGLDVETFRDVVLSALDPIDLPSRTGFTIGWETLQIPVSSSFTVSYDRVELVSSPGRVRIRHLYTGSRRGRIKSCGHAAGSP